MYDTGKVVQKEEDEDEDEGEGEGEGEDEDEDEGSCLATQGAVLFKSSHKLSVWICRVGPASSRGGGEEGAMLLNYR